MSASCALINADSIALMTFPVVYSFNEKWIFIWIFYFAQTEGIQKIFIENFIWFAFTGKKNWRPSTIRTWKEYAAFSAKKVVAKYELSIADVNETIRCRSHF